MNLSLNSSALFSLTYSSGGGLEVVYRKSKGRAYRYVCPSWLPGLLSALAKRLGSWGSAFFRMKRHLVAISEVNAPYPGDLEADLRASVAAGGVE